MTTALGAPQTGCRMALRRRRRLQTSAGVGGHGRASGVAAIDPSAAVACGAVPSEAASMAMRRRGGSRPAQVDGAGLARPTTRAAAGGRAVGGGTRRGRRRRPSELRSEVAAWRRRRSGATCGSLPPMLLRQPRSRARHVASAEATRRWRGGAASAQCAAVRLARSPESGQKARRKLKKLRQQSTIAAEAPKDLEKALHPHHFAASHGQLSPRCESTGKKCQSTGKNCQSTGSFCQPSGSFCQPSGSFCHRVG